LLFDEWLQFDWPLFNLPREVKLEVTLIGVKTIAQSDPVSSSPTSSSGMTVNNQESELLCKQLIDTMEEQLIQFSIVLLLN